VRGITFEFIQPDTVQIGSYKWLEPWYETIKGLVGFDFQNPQISLPENRKDLISPCCDGKLHKMADGLSVLAGCSVSVIKCRELERTIGAAFTYISCIRHSGILSGGVVIFSPQIISKDDIQKIETLISHALLSISRIAFEKDLRLSEANYRKLNRELERKVIERTQDLESANIRLRKELAEGILRDEALKKSESSLKELNATKDKFSNIIAHDLKNPFTSLIGSSELLFQNIHQLEKEEIIQLSKILNDSAKGGYAILQNLLDWSRSQTGLLKINPEKINLKDLLDENIEDAGQFSGYKEIEIHSELKGDLIIVADRNMINTVLRNLLSNAVKYSYRFGKVSVNAASDGKEVTISVKDNGIGVPEENRDKIFRIDSEYSETGTENEQGTGLGLKLSREFVEKQGGKIWVESTENGGSVFKFSIPAGRN